MVSRVIFCVVEVGVVPLSSSFKDTACEDVPFSHTLKVYVELAVAGIRLESTVPPPVTSSTIESAVVAPLGEASELAVMVIPPVFVQVALSSCSE